MGFVVAWNEFLKICQKENKTKRRKSFQQQFQ